VLNLDIATPIVRWQAVSGRNHLPWQQTRDPYRVWLSEVMLQQTQVATVLEYYSRFLVRFPNVSDLAAASEDEVLALWSGLGYYSRARNLHRCAQAVMAEHGGLFPSSAEMLQTLPGIGRSTAGAIAAFCFSERVPILDANVRRVLTRVLGFGLDLAEVRNERVLWGHAHDFLPLHDLSEAMPRYTQGLMDLGSEICKPKAPRCEACPIAVDCVARAEGSAEKYPVKTRKLKRSAQSWWLLIQRNAQGAYWLERRPASGIWAGLYCPPVFHEESDLNSWTASQEVEHLEPFVHVLTHRDLHLHPVLIPNVSATFQPTEAGAWFGSADLLELGLPAPIRKLLAAEEAKQRGAVT
jgi:A/G-specific adenine glycosylase